MDKQAILDSILKSVTQEVREWLDEHEKIKDPYIYEQRLLQRAINIGKTMMVASGGKLSKDRNAKKKS